MIKNKMRAPSKIIAENYFNAKSENPNFSLSPIKGSVIHVFGDTTKPLNKMALSYVAKHRDQNIKFEPSQQTQAAFNIDNVYSYNFGKGHFIQKVARVLNIPIPTVPKGYISSTAETTPGKIAICTDDLDLDAIIQLGLFADSFCSVHEIVQVGNPKDGNYTLDSAEILKVKSSSDKIAAIEDCEYVICGNNEYAHYAAALDKKLITIVSDIPASKLYLPCMSDVSLVQEIYPQSVILHTSEENELVPMLSKESLMAAVLGHVYPYWSDEYLKLVKNEI